MVRNAALEAATKAEKASKSPKVAKVPKAKRTSTEPKTKRAFSESVAGDEKKKRRPRKPKISAEFVQDDSDTDFEAGEAQEQEQEQEQHPSGDVQDSPVIGSSPHKTVNTKVNTRKSDQAVSTTNEDTDLDDEADFGAGQKRTLGNEGIFKGICMLGMDICFPLLFGF
ncbi:hypothetical protein P280DRAFT_308052 [Massarina eburnea CBS 473.64]|uniref:Uncharacterized protein n=1 Tax=Massarina eburnea CBS 473.64 TaxID=1395130 RepID=A0A6A6S2D3_9PLEO|nr:hypothetical protein P280DRAFT_308052 [Massarina eburnea CBS 473.64]